MVGLYILFSIIGIGCLVIAYLDEKLGIKKPKKKEKISGVGEKPDIPRPKPAPRPIKKF